MAEFNRGTGLLVIEVNNSNPNGDPDAESEPRTLDVDGRGLISPVSFKRKLRDLVAEKEGHVWRSAVQAVGLTGANRGFDILEMRNRNRDEIWAIDAQAFKDRYWDARIAGNTFLEDKEKGKKDNDEVDPTATEKRSKKSKEPKGDKSHFITTGVVQFGPGISVSPIEVIRLTMTNKAGVEGNKDRGMAPLAWRVVQHAIYVMPFFVNSTAALKSGCDAKDIDLLKFVIPHAYRHTASAVRPFVEVLHAWYAEHKTPLGSCPDSLIVNAMTPARTDETKTEEPSHSIADYRIPTELPSEVRSRLASFEDLCAKSWA